MEFRVCSGEIPPCSFETARRLLWRNTNNELLPVYDHQLCEWYLQTQILRCECLGDNKWLLISLKSEFVTQIWGKSTTFPQIWVTNSDLSDQLKFEWNRLVSPRFEWTLKFERSPRIEGITSDHPELSASPNFEGGHLPVNILWDDKSSPGNRPSSLAISYATGVSEWLRLTKF